MCLCVYSLGLKFERWISAKRISQGLSESKFSNLSKKCYFILATFNLGLKFKNYNFSKCTYQRGKFSNLRQRCYFVLITAFSALNIGLSHVTCYLVSIALILRYRFAKNCTNPWAQLPIIAISLRGTHKYRWVFQCYVCVCYLPYLALPLTFNNVFEAVKTMRSWRELAPGLMGWYASQIKEKLFLRRGSLYIG